jgi:catechol 2,3-dioxygenase-like lactoylglutathione lyase family enzyme
VIDHVGLGVSNLEQSKVFYRQALHPHGYQVLLERDGSVGFGRNGKPDFFIHVNRPLSGPTHILTHISRDPRTMHPFLRSGRRPIHPACGPDAHSRASANQERLRRPCHNQACFKGPTGRDLAAMLDRPVASQTALHLTAASRAGVAAGWGGTTHARGGRDR